LPDDEQLTAEMIMRMATPGEWERWVAIGAQTGWCQHPIRLVGGVTRVDPSTGEILSTYSTFEEPAGVLLLACRSRFASKCPTCSQTYQLMQFILFRVGLTGGKEVPESVALHPRASATLTAPGFGTAVHSSLAPASICTSGSGSCQHGRARSCLLVHGQDDAVIGAPLCKQCFNYPHLVLWHRMYAALWTRTQLEVTRQLAAVTGMTQRATHKIIKVSHTGVTEYQRRLCAHKHAIFRLDARTPVGTPPQLPPAPFDDPRLLVAAIQIGAARARVRLPAYPGVPAYAMWGTQLDIRAIMNPTSEPS